MCIASKTTLLHAVLDELACFPFLDGEHQKAKAVNTVQGIILEFPKPYNLKTKSDFTIKALGQLSSCPNACKARWVQGMATLAEKALTETINGK